MINPLWLITVIKVLGMIVTWGYCLLTKASVFERDHSTIILPVYNQEILVWPNLTARVFVENVSGICVCLWGPRNAVK